MDQKRPFGDAASRNGLKRFGTAFQKKYFEQLEGFDEDTFRGEEREEVAALFAFIDDVWVLLPSRMIHSAHLCPRKEMDVDAQSEAGSSRRKGRSSRRAVSMSREPSEAPSEADDATTAAVTSDEEEEAEAVVPRKKAPPRSGNGRGRAMQAVEEGEEEEDEDEDDDVESILDD